MKEDKETRQRLMECAKAEFFEKGYMKASLRNICKNAGVTTGAMYFFFKDKNDLLIATVWKPIQVVKEAMLIHYEEEKEFLSEHRLIDMDYTEDFEVAVQIIDMMYAHREEFIIALTKSQGSSVEGVLDEFISITEKHYRHLANMISKAKGIPKIHDYTVHWVSHTQINAFIHVLTHIPNREDALIFLKETILYLMGGWCSIFDLPIPTMEGNKENKE